MAHPISSTLQISIRLDRYHIEERLYIETLKDDIVNVDTGVSASINYDNDHKKLTLAYALTIHKSQGSQWPVVICPIAQKSIILNRKLMYTMYTRAEDTNILIGNPDYISNAISDDREDRRISLLGQRLKEMYK